MALQVNPGLSHWNDWITRPKNRPHESRFLYVPLPACDASHSGRNVAISIVFDGLPRDFLQLFATICKLSKRWCIKRKPLPIFARTLQLSEKELRNSEIVLSQWPVPNAFHIEES